MKRRLSYFLSDVHLGLDVCDPAAREERLVRFLRAIPVEETEALVLLGDIWDFWYEYRDVVPAGYARVFAAIQDMIAAGVEVHFFSGNHDVWCYRYFADMGIQVYHAPEYLVLGGHAFLVGHGDGLGPGLRGYKLVKSILRSPVTQWMYSSLLPVRAAFWLGRRWSRKSRLARQERYVFKGETEPLYIWAAEQDPEPDFFVFGHFHCQVDMILRDDIRFLVLGDWLEGMDVLRFDGHELTRISDISQV